MTSNVLKLLSEIVTRDFPDCSKEAVILKKIIASGMNSINTYETVIFSQSILPVIRNNTCECWSCNVDVSDRVVDVLYEFLETGLCPVCNEDEVIRDAAAL
ncbi:hypothetical protein L6270_01640 [Candidatus Parcubacteria bacterium]|nr:hypothetical protein [Patescibacteria group bacterium]MBU4309842.1 hypothetical protein [Patescibacteria group bacterium]MBU4431985.1 hypothetical protein [Patescibacteria group bacterium]MBU4578181.1 hypothetical protein [Patescibacteria group bacterium]MCG2696717.1 hypothetical protein [Candidatus Parcubacteria bacterium]